MDAVKFIVDSGNTKYDLVFENGIVVLKLLVKIKECRYDEVTGVQIKNAFMSGGGMISFCINYLNNGKQKSFPWIDARMDDPSTAACLDYMKQVFPSDIQWIDNRKNEHSTVKGNQQYDLQFSLALLPDLGIITLPRTFQLVFWTLITAAFLLPLPYFLKILITGGYKIYTDEQVLEVRKFFSKKFRWDEIERVEVVRWKILDVGSGNQQRILKVTIVGKTSGSSSGIMRLDHGIPFLNKMNEHHLIDPDLLSLFV